MKNQKQEVLFQKLGNQWFIFSEKNGTLIFTALPKGINPLKTDFSLYEVIRDLEEKSSRSPYLERVA